MWIVTLPVVKPRNMVAGTDMDAVGVYSVLHLGGNCAGLGNLLRHQPLSFQHVQEVGISTEIQLVSVFYLHAAVFEQGG